MNGSSFRPDNRPRHNNRFRRRPPNWNPGVGRGSPRLFEDGEIQSQSPRPPPSPPWRRRPRFPRPFKRYRRHDFPARSRSPSPRSQPPYLGPVPMLEIPTRRRSRFDITPEDARNGWHKLDLPDHKYPDRSKSEPFRTHLPDVGIDSGHRPIEKMPTVPSFHEFRPMMSGRSLDRPSFPPLWPTPSSLASNSNSSSPNFGIKSADSMANRSLSTTCKNDVPASGSKNESWGPSPVALRSELNPLSVVDTESSYLTSHPSGYQSAEAGINRLSHGFTTPSTVNAFTVPFNPGNSTVVGDCIASTATSTNAAAASLPLPTGSSLSSVIENAKLEAADSRGLQIMTYQRTDPSPALSSSAACRTSSDIFPLTSVPIASKSELLQQIQKLDDEIAEIEQKISLQRNLIDEKTAASNDNEVKDDEIVTVIAESEDCNDILTENRRLATLSSQALSKLNPSWLNERLSDGPFYEPLYREPGQSEVYRQVERDLLKNRPRFFRALRSRKLSALNEECRLSLQWWSHYLTWHRSLTKADFKFLSPLRHPLTPDQRAYYSSRLATIPPMFSERDRQMASWCSRNALVEDPRAQDQHRKLINPWSEQEKAVFRKKFSKFPKNFVKLASFLPNKSVGDCVAYYYSSKTLVNYKALVKKYRQSLLSRKGIDITGHIEGTRSSRTDAPALPSDHNEAKPSTIPRELLKLAEDLSRNNLEVQSGRGRAGKKRRTDSGDLSNASLDGINSAYT